ncbi:hypothetical protein CHLNCDRAFT_54232 [Chlorella variabilis]|uniref:CBM20 domain-containing protein n=1 Tax=Chlorella variabilis TaxID=554065 RepID=E1ZN34_CHLVA|nr:hypothetical protein CHLNCDRAFT_54232 [Chlorella variabilis]EFN52802.1 hypothetical protein CHLNCDRAFT_54232 [Chlorella variabilis]|eukprot:XP_005844904.1 hypothetical protein CHLNCDRAFT_54232 [Chlorella variabilis]
MVPLATRAPPACAPARRTSHVACSNRRGAVGTVSTKPRLMLLRAVAAQTVQARAGGAGTVAVTFTINKKLNFGQQMVLVGDAEALGAWELERAPVLTWSEGDDWRVTLDLPAGSQLEYKFAVTSPHEPPVWEECANRSWSAETPFAVLGCSWDSTEVSTRAGARDGGLMLDLPPAYKPAQAMPNSFSAALAKRRDAVTAVNGAMAAASGATAAAEAVVAAAEAAAAAVAQAVTAAEAVVAELSAAGSSSALKAQPVNATLVDAHYSPEQLAFLNRKRSGSPGMAAQATAVASRPAQQTAAAAAEAVLAATTAAAGAAANVVAVAESVAAELTGAAPAAGAAASPAKAHHAAPSAAAGASYTPEQLEFMRRKLNSSVRAQPAAANGAAPAAASRAGPAPAGHEAAYSPEQLEFLRRKGVSPQSAAPPPPPPARPGSPTRPQAPRPSSRPRSPSPSGGAAPGGQHYSPEQLAFLRRAGKA